MRASAASNFLLIGIVVLTEYLDEYGAIHTMAIHLTQEGLYRLVPDVRRVAMAVDHNHA